MRTGSELRLNLSIDCAEGTRPSRTSIGDFSNAIQPNSLQRVSLEPARPRATRDSWASSAGQASDPNAWHPNHDPRMPKARWSRTRLVSTALTDRARRSRSSFTH